MRPVRYPQAKWVLSATAHCAEGAASVCGPIQDDDREEPLLWLPDRCAPVELQQEHGAADLPVEELAGKEAAVGFPAADRSLVIGGKGPEPAVVD